MGKQTMGTPGLSWVHRTDNKSYRIQTPQAPIVHNQLYRDYEFDTYKRQVRHVSAGNEQRGGCHQLHRVIVIKSRNA